MRKLVSEIRRRGYSIRTEQAYGQWVTRYLRFHDTHNPAELGAAQVTQFLEYLAVDRHVAASTQNQALNALVLLYSQILDSQLGRPDDIVRAKRPRRLPVVLTRTQV
jgi:site-specific recombinase XerD